jgi:hypothetical protein
MLNEKASRGLRVASDSPGACETAADFANETARNIRLEHGDPRELIARLEARIDDLAEVMERCRKIILASKVAIACGGIWMLAALFGAVGLDPLALIAAIAAVIGGTVVFGSNTTTAKQISAAMRDAEQQRAALIGGLELRVVDDGAAPPDR